MTVTGKIQKFRMREIAIAELGLRRAGMSLCAICGGAVEGPRLGDCHPACVAERVPEDALAALIAASLLLLAPLIVIWAA